MEHKRDITIAREILRLRLSQMIVNEKYKAGLFKIPLHIALGHEAIAVAVDSVMGEKDQLDHPKFKDLIQTVAKEAGVTGDQIEKILNQTLSTTFKRSSGYGVPLLITSRTEMGLPEIDSKEFSALALQAIQS